MNIGENIKRLRKEKGLTQKQLAEKAQIALNSIINYETGKRSPSVEMIKKISAALDVPISFLIDIHDYVDLANAEMEQSYKEFESFWIYLESMGYIIFQEGNEKDGFFLTITKDGITKKLTGGNLNDIEPKVKDYIEYLLMYKDIID